jgi:hypothetical protein
VGDVDSTIAGTLHGTENTGTSGGPLKTDIENGLEGAAALLRLLGELVLTVGLGNTLEFLVQAELGESTAGEKETGSVGGGPVGETVLDAVAGELVRVGGGEDLVTDNLRGDDLHDDLYSRQKFPHNQLSCFLYLEFLIWNLGKKTYVLVGEADNEPVLGRIVLVLRLGDQPLTGIVIGLSLTSTTVLGLVA